MYIIEKCTLTPHNRYCIYNCQNNLEKFELLNDFFRKVKHIKIVIFDHLKLLFSQKSKKKQLIIDLLNILN